MKKRQKNDITSPPDLKSHGEGTGPDRQQRPVYVDLLPPCNNACPAGENIQAWLALAQAERYEEAWVVVKKSREVKAIIEKNSLKQLAEVFPEPNE